MTTRTAFLFFPLLLMQEMAANPLGVTPPDRPAEVKPGDASEPVVTVRGHPTKISSLRFSQDGKRIASASWGNGIVNIWDRATGQLVLGLKAPRDTIFGLAFSRDGHYLASASEVETVRIWDLKSGKTLQTLPGHPCGIRNVAFSPDAKYLVVGSNDGMVKVWDMSSGKEAVTCQGHIDGRIAVNITGVAVSPDGRRVISSSSVLDRSIEWGRVMVWDALTGQAAMTINAAADFVRLDAKATRIAGAHWSGMSVWDAATGKEVHRLEIDDGAVEDICFTPDNQCLAAQCKLTSKTIIIWDVMAKKKLGALKGYDNRKVAFSPDGKALAVATDAATVEVWDLGKIRKQR